MTIITSAFFTIQGKLMSVCLFQVRESSTWESYLQFGDPLYYNKNIDYISKQNSFFILETEPSIPIF